MLVDLRDKYASRPIIFLGEYEPSVSQALKARLRDSTRFLDIGANIGYYSLLVAARCPKGKVVAFEPDAGNFDLLSANLALNRFRDRVTCYPFAVGESSGSIVLSDLGNKVNRGARFTATDAETLKKHEHGPNPRYETVTLKSIDEFLPSDDFDWVKIDIEGYEPFALRGMSRLLQRCQPNLVIEFAPDNLRFFGGVEPPEMLAWILSLAPYKMSVIGRRGELLHCRTVHEVMKHHAEAGAHHLDLLFLAP